MNMHMKITALAVAALTVAGLAGCTRTIVVHDTPTPTAGTEAPVFDQPSDTPTSAFDYLTELPTLTVKILSRDCTPGYGCVMRVQPVLAMLSTADIPADASGSITYEVDGGKDGPIIDTFDLTGAQYSPSEEVVQTPTTSAKVTIKVTDVTTD